MDSALDQPGSLGYAQNMFSTIPGLSYAMPTTIGSTTTPAATTSAASTGTNAATTSAGSPDYTSYLTNAISQLLSGSGLGTADTSGNVNSSVSNPYGSSNIGSSVNLTGSPTYGSTPSLGSTYSQIAGMSPTTTTTQSNTQNPSAALQNMINSMGGNINTLGQNTNQAYQGLQSSYGNLMNTLTNLYGQQGSSAQGSAATSALGMGANPLAASQAGLGAQQNMLSQYFPALASLQTQAATVPVQAQQAQQSIQQQLGLPLMQIASPYYQNVAGQNMVNQVTDPMKQAQILANLSTSGSSMGLQQQQLQSQMAQAQMAQQANYSNMGLQATSQNIQQQQYAQSQAYQAQLMALLSKLGVVSQFGQQFPNTAYQNPNTNGVHDSIWAESGLGGGTNSTPVPGGGNVSVSGYGYGDTIPGLDNILNTDYNNGPISGLDESDVSDEEY